MDGKVPPILQAAHIQIIRKRGKNYVDNGLLLRSGMHALFDRKFMAVTCDYTIKVSQEVKHRYDNGREYYQFCGRR